MQPGPDRHAQPGDIPRVGRNLGFDQDNIQWGIHFVERRTDGGEAISKRLTTEHTESTEKNQDGETWVYGSTATDRSEGSGLLHKLIQTNVMG